MEPIDSLAQSVATMEGYFKPNTIGQRNNNPGNPRSWGANPVKNGYAVFNSPEEGWAALRKRIKLGGKYDPKRHDIDHIVPISRGGSHTGDNLRVLPEECASGTMKDPLLEKDQ